MQDCFFCTHLAHLTLEKANRVMEGRRWNHRSTSHAVTYTACVSLDLQTSYRSLCAASTIWYLKSAIPLYSAIAFVLYAYSVAWASPIQPVAEMYSATLSLPIGISGYVSRIRCMRPGLHKRACFWADWFMRTCRYLTSLFRRVLWKALVEAFKATLAHIRMGMESSTFTWHRGTFLFFRKINIYWHTQLPETAWVPFTLRPQENMQTQTNFEYNKPIVVGAFINWCELKRRRWQKRK